MLLSDVFYIAKNLNSYTLNESLKSKTLRDLFKPLNYSNLTLTSKRHHTNYSWEQNEEKGATFFDVEWAYRDTLRNNALTQELCDTMEGRQYMINRIYMKRKKKLVYGNRYTDNGPIYDIITKIQDKTGYNIGLSEIQDSNLVCISTDDAKKKIYKSGLQFWVDYDNNLIAVTIDNSIVLYISKSSSYSSWYEPNPDYKEVTDIESLKNQDNLEQFIEKAFKEIPYYNILISSADIKNALGANNIKALQTKSNAVKVYVVNDEGMQLSNYTEKLKTRAEWKTFLNAQLDMAYNNIKRYEAQIKLHKIKGDDVIIGNSIQEFMNLCLQVLMDVQDYETEFLSNNEKEFMFNDSYSLSVEVDYNYYANLKNIDKYKVFQGFKPDRYNSRHKYKVNMCSIDSVCDCFVIINIYLNNLILKANSTIIRYNECQELLKKADINNNQLIDAMSSLKYSYINLKDTVTGSYDKTLSYVIKLLLTKKNIDVEQQLLNPLKTFQFQSVK